MYETREQAERMCVAYNRERMRKEMLGDFLFEDRDAIAAVTKIMKAAFPDAYDYSDTYWFFEQGAQVPEEATDAQVDAILEAGKLLFAKVFTYRPERDDAKLDPMLMADMFIDADPEVIYWGATESDREFPVE